jgi:hypothetical protein
MGVDLSPKAHSTAEVTRPASEHDPEKWKSVFGKRSCSKKAVARKPEVSLRSGAAHLEDGDGVEHWLGFVITDSKSATSTGFLDRPEYQNWWSLLDYAEHSVVIGNKYENPELLK